MNTTSMQDSEHSLPTHLEYQYLVMADRLLTISERKFPPSYGLYQVAQNLFYSRERLGLNFPPNFIIKMPVEAELEGQLQRRDHAAIEQLRLKLAAVHKTVKARIDDVRRTTNDAPEEILEKNETEKNVDELASALKFNDIQRNILYFFACAEKGRFTTLLDALNYDDVSATSVSQEDYTDNLAALLGLQKKEAASLKAELDPDSILVGVKFLTRTDAVAYKVDTSLQRILLSHYSTPNTLLNSLLGPAPVSDLTLDDYTYMQHDLRDMTRTLSGFFKTKRPISKNMTIGGPPGTGKTELTAVLGNQLGVSVHLVGVAQKSEKTGFSMEEPSRDDRINALVRSAFIVRKTGMHALLVFDEAEDVLRDLNRSDKDEGSKAFINELLENLGTPVVFISNRTDLFDPATIRRILPYYSMNYMPANGRIKAIIDKAKTYMGIDLTEADVQPLSALATNLSVAVIDRCLIDAALCVNKQPSKAQIIGQIKREFERSLKAQNGGVPTAPLPKPFDVHNFDPALISASDAVADMRDRFSESPARLAGKDFTVIGPAGTGRTSIAKYLATATGAEPRIIPMNLAAIAQDPDNAHALDLERASLDRTPVVFTDALGFLQSSNGHPLLDRIRAHPQPTFFVSDLPRGVSPEELQEGLAHLTFVVRTGYLTPAQLQSACKQFLNIEFTEEELKDVRDMSIGSVMKVKEQLKALNQEGDKEAALARMDTIATRLQDAEKGPIGFVSRTEKIPRAVTR